MKKLRELLTIVLVGITGVVFGQNFTTSASGAWTTGSNWSGGTAPSLTNEVWGTVNINHDMTITGNYSVPNSTVNINAGKTLTITGNLSVAVGSGGGNTINVYGTLQVNGNITLGSDLKIFPGGKVIVNGNMVVTNAQYLTVGTAVAPPAYADLVIKQDLVSQNSGDVVVKQNGRMAVYGNLTNNTSGGSLLTINSGGQVYINGNINLTAGGNTITNSNASSPYGLYVNGTISNPSSTTTSNKADKATMQSSNPTFTAWVAAQPNSPLPVTLLFFSAKAISESGVALTWTTASELNFNFFEVERSSDGSAFESITRVQGNGTTMVRHDYSWTDRSPLIGNNYYRLKTVDYDGFTEFFDVIMIKWEGEKSVMIYPNPVVGGKVNVEFNFTLDQYAIASVSDLSGAVVDTYLFSENGKELTLNLNPGTYILTVQSGGFKKVSRLLVK